MRQRRWMGSILLAWGAAAIAVAGCAAATEDRSSAGSQAMDLAVSPALPGRTALALDERAPVEVAKARAQKWLDALGPQGLVLQISERRPSRGFLALCRYGGRPCPPGGVDSAFDYLSDAERGIDPIGGSRIKIGIGFSQDISPSTPLAVVRHSFEWLSLERVPPGDLRVPGWMISPLTRVSSFREGVEIVSFTGRRIKLRARGHFFSLYGHKEGSDCIPLADAPARPECFFALERDFPFDITVDLPIFPAL